MLSVGLTDMRGFEACIEILETAPNTRVVMTQTQLSNEGIVATIMAGGAGYLPKDAGRTDIVRTVRANGLGAMYHIPPVAERALRLMEHGRQVLDLERLTKQEKKVLVLVANGLNNTEIAARLKVSRHMVRSHVSTMFRKLNISTRAQLGALASVIGLLDVHDDGEG